MYHGATVIASCRIQGVFSWIFQINVPSMCRRRHGLPLTKHVALATRLIMDKLDTLISNKKAEIDEINKQIERLAKRHDRLLIEMDALKQAAELRPVSPLRSVAPAVSTGRGPGTRGGRQKGDISHDWRNVLRDIAALHRRVSYGEIQMVAENNKIKAKLPSVRERVRNLVDTKLMTGNAKSGFLVTKHAIERFGLANDEAPNVATSGASKTGEEQDVLASPSLYIPPNQTRHG